MSDRQPLVVTPEQRENALKVVGTDVVVLAAASATEGCGFTFQQGPEGTGPPPHSHSWDEAFYVLEGDIVFSVGDESVTCRPGTLVHVPAGTVHAFQYGPGGARMLEITGPGSRAAELFRDLDAELAPGPPDLPKVVEIFDRHDAQLGI